MAGVAFGKLVCLGLGSLGFEQGASQEERALAKDVQRKTILKPPDFRSTIPGSGSRKAPSQAPTHEASMCLRLDTAILKEQCKAMAGVALGKLVVLGLGSLGFEQGASQEERALSNDVQRKTILKPLTFGLLFPGRAVARHRRKHLPTKLRFVCVWTRRF